MGEKEMLELTIDRKKVQARQGATILEAARASGIHIPTLCYHAHLSPVGSCRVCLVEVDGASDPVASCNTSVRDGMVVKTDSARIRRMRTAMVELVLVDHPLECPVCDKAGECELQDIVYELGITQAQFEPIGLTREINEINHFIGRYPNRCILCGRCVRACENVQGASVMSYVQRHGYQGEIAVCNRDTIECEQCGQCLRVCPVGALIEQGFKYRARAWELAKTDTTCPYCGVGCTLTLNTKQGEIKRVTSEHACSTGESLCVRGRFGMGFVSSKNRLESPMIRKKGTLVPAQWDEALDLVADRLGEIKKGSGSDSIAVFGSARCTNEDNYQLQKFARGTLGTNNIDFSDRAAYANTLSGIADVLGRATAATNSLVAVEDCDAVLVLDADVSETNPMFSLNIQNAARERGADLFVIDGRRTKLARFATKWLALTPGTEALVLAAILRHVCEHTATPGSVSAEQRDRLVESLKDSTLDATAEASGLESAALAGVAESLLAAERAAIVLSGLAGRDVARLAADLALLTGSVRAGGGVYVTGLSNNWQGAVDMGIAPTALPGGADVADESARSRLEELWGCDVPAAPGIGAAKTVEAAASGAIRGLYIMGDNPLTSLPGAAEAFSKADFVVVQDILGGPLSDIADVVLPAASFAEKRGTFTSMDRSVQRVRPALEPAGESRADSRILADIAVRMGTKLDASAQEIMNEIAKACPPYEHISYAALDEGAIRWPAAGDGRAGSEAMFEDGFSDGYPKLALAIPTGAVQTDDEYGLRLVTGQRRFHSGSLSRSSGGLSDVYPEPLLEVCPEDGEVIGVKDAARVRVTSLHGSVTARVKITGRSRPGVVFLPYGFAEASAAVVFGWNGAARATKTAVRIEKV